MPKQVNLSSGTANGLAPNTWYFVKLEKQADGSWTISAKAFGDSSYTSLEASSEFFGSSNATFGTMFRTYNWNEGYNVYATNVWGATITDSEIVAWEAAGAEKLGSAINSSVALDEKLGSLAVYKTNGGYGQSIVNKSVDASNYKNLNDMGINGYIFNLGNFGNPADAQTGFSAFKTYIDSRAMTDSSVTYEQLKDEFFGVNGYYGAAGPTMRAFFEELESVMDAKKQTSNYVNYEHFSHHDYDATEYPYYHYYTDGTSKQAVRTTQADRVQAWFNGAFGLSQMGILFGDITDEDLKVATSVGATEMPDSAHAALTFTPQTNLYIYGEKTQLETLKAWYQYCATAKGMVAADSVYAKRIQVESWFLEYALRLFHSTYTVNFELVRSLTANYSATCTGITSTLSADTGLNRSATEFYNELIAGGMVRPSEQYTFDTAEMLSLGWVQNFYRNDGQTVFKNANCICEISASAFVNWGAC